MLQVTWRSVRHHPLRFFLSLLAVFLGTAYVAGTFMLNGLLTYTFDGIVSTSLDADLYIEPASVDAAMAAMGSSSGQIQSDLADLVNPLPGVLQAAPEFTATAIVHGADGTPMSSGYAPTLLIGNSAGPWDDRIVDQVDGRAPVGPNEIAIDNASAAKGGLKAGDRTQIVLPDEVRDVTVSGIYTFNHSFAGAIVILMAVDEVRQIFFPTGLVGSIAVYAEDGVDPASLVDPITAVLPPESQAHVILGQDLRDESKASIHSTLGFVNDIILVFAVVAALLASVLILTTFNFVVRSELREIAVLRAVGASTRQVFRSVVSQAAIVGLIGSLLGIGGGYGLVMIIRLVMQGMGMDMGAVPFSATGAVWAVAGGLGVSALGALWPAHRAASIPPVEAMREAPPELKTTGRSRAVVALSCLATGIGCLIVAVAVDWRPTWWLGAGAVAVVAGVFALMPVISPGIVTVVGWPLARLAGPAGSLGRGNVANNPRRVAITAGVLMAVMAVVGGFTVIVWSSRAQLQDKITSEFASDYVVRNLSPGMTGLPIVPTEVVDQVDGLDGVDAYLQRAVPASVQGAGGVAVTGVAMVVPDDFFTRVMRSTVVKGSADRANGQAVLLQSAADQLGVDVGQSLHVTIAPDTPLATVASLPVGLVVRSEVMGDNVPAGLKISVILPADWFDATVPPQTAAQFAVNLNLFVNIHEGVDKEQVHQQLLDIIRPFSTLVPAEGADLISSANSQINTLLIVMYALLALSLIIAALGVANTLVLSVAERTREIGLLRAIGLGRGQLTGMITAEAVLISFLGVILGLAVGVFVGSFYPRAMADAGLGTVAIPWQYVGLMLVGAGVMGVLAAVVPAIRATRIPVLDAIAYE